MRFVTRGRDTAARAAGTLVGAAALLLLGAATLVPPAVADIAVGGSGSGAGQYLQPEDIAADTSNGNLFVADSGNNRVDIFAADGTFIRAFGWGVADGTSSELQTCTSTCFKGIAGTGAGEFSRPGAIAVDSDPTSPAFHDVYVYASDRVQKFTPNGEFLAAWGGGVVTGGAVGSGDLSSGSSTIAAVKTTRKPSSRVRRSPAPASVRDPHRRRRPGHDYPLSSGHRLRYGGCPQRRCRSRKYPHRRAAGHLDPR